VTGMTIFDDGPGADCCRLTAVGSGQAHQNLICADLEKNKKSHIRENCLGQAGGIKMFERARYKSAANKIMNSLENDLRVDGSELGFLRSMLSSDQFFRRVLKLRSDMGYSSWTRGIRDSFDWQISLNKDLTADQKKILCSGQIASWIVDGHMKSGGELNWSEIRHQMHFYFDDYGLLQEADSEEAP